MVVLNPSVVNDEMFTFFKEVYTLLQDNTLIHIDFFKYRYIIGLVIDWLFLLLCISYKIITLLTQLSQIKALVNIVLFVQ